MSLLNGALNSLIRAFYKDASPDGLEKSVRHPAFILFRRDKAWS